MTEVTGITTGQVTVSLGVGPSSTTSRAAQARARTAKRAAAKAAHHARRANAPRPRRSEDELRAVAERGQAELGGSGVGAPDEASAELVIAWAVREFGTGLAVASSMSDHVLAHLVAQQLPWVDVLFGDTGYHFVETLGTRDAVEHELDVTVIDVRPPLSVAEQDALHGPRLHDHDPEACCRMRKVEPMRFALEGYEAWAAGVRRRESTTRATAPLVSYDEKNGLVKINPIAGWNDDDVVAYALRHRLPVNPLLDDGYPSIGCAPCTRRVATGEDARAGRWAGLDKTECGLHT